MNITNEELQEQKPLQIPPREAIFLHNTLLKVYESGKMSEFVPVDTADVFVRVLKRSKIYVSVAAQNIQQQRKRRQELKERKSAESKKPILAPQKSPKAPRAKFDESSFQNAMVEARGSS